VRKEFSLDGTGRFDLQVEPEEGGAPAQRQKSREGWTAEPGTVAARKGQTSPNKEMAVRAMMPVAILKSRLPVKLVHELTMLLTLENFWQGRHIFAASATRQSVSFVWCYMRVRRGEA
jgi:hypothetical protein